MRTTVIIQNLLKYSKAYEYSENSKEFPYPAQCPECKEFPENGHKEGCEFVATIKGAEEYLKLMKVEK